MISHYDEHYWLDIDGEEILQGIFSSEEDVIQFYYDFIK